MESTVAEIIFWAILNVIGWGFFIFVLTRPSNHINITEKKLREWEQEESRWR